MPKRARRTGWSRKSEPRSVRKFCPSIRDGVFHPKGPARTVPLPEIVEGEDAVPVGLAAEEHCHPATAIIDHRMIKPSGRPAGAA